MKGLFITLEDLPVPPMLLRAIGYPEEKSTARFVGLCWVPWGDESYYLDGRLEGTGNPWAYLEYFNHQRVAMVTQNYNLGSSEKEPEYIFIIDRYQWQANIARQDMARQFLRDQWGDPIVLEEKPVKVSREDLQKIVESFREVSPPSKEQIQAIHVEQSELIKELKFWIKENL